MSIFNFAHYFIEWGFMVGWLHAIYFGSWAYTASNIVLFIDGHKAREAMSMPGATRDFPAFADIDSGGGSGGGFVSRIVRSVANPVVLHSGAVGGPDEKARGPPGVMWMPRAIVGGDHGMSLWNHETYTEPRPANRFDELYPALAKARPYQNYIARFVAANAGTSSGIPARHDPTYSQIAEDDAPYIFLINRKPDHSTPRGMMRTVSNVKQLHFELQKRYGVAAVHPEIIHFSDFVDSVSDTIDLLRQVRVMIAPHGANLANIGFMVPGAGMLELGVSGHSGHPMMFEAVANANSIAYEVSYCGGDHWGAGPITAKINSELWSKVDKLLDATHPTARATARAKVAQNLMPYDPTPGWSTPDPQCAEG
jgi:hypothetical protein